MLACFAMMMFWLMYLAMTMAVSNLQGWMGLEVIPDEILVKLEKRIWKFLHKREEKMEEDVDHETQAWKKMVRNF